MNPPSPASLPVSSTNDLDVFGTALTEELAVQESFSDVREALQKCRLRPDGEPLTPDDALRNIVQFGAESPRMRYCQTLPVIGLVEVAKEFGLKIEIVRAWATRGKWESRREAWRNTIPLELGGLLLEGDASKFWEWAEKQHLAANIEAMKVTEERIRARREQQVGKMSVETLDKTSDSHFKDVQALMLLQNQVRTACGKPTKLSATYQQSDTKRTVVTESVVRAPSNAPNFEPSVSENGPRQFEQSFVDETTETEVERTRTLLAESGESDDPKDYE